MRTLKGKVTNSDAIALGDKNPTVQTCAEPSESSLDSWCFVPRLQLKQETSCQENQNVFFNFTMNGSGNYVIV